MKNNLLKKLSSGLLITALTATAFVGCGNSSADA